jgi:hypothetical protein
MDLVLQEDDMNNINKTKTKILVCGREKRDAVVTLKGPKSEEMDSFAYIGSTILWDGRSTVNVK